MTRRKAAWLALVALVLLGGALVVSRRRSPAPAAVTTGTPSSPPVPTVPAVPAAPAVEVETDVVEPVAADPTVQATTRKPAPRSWGGGRAIPAATPAPSVRAAADTADTAGDEVEQPLPTWARVAIITAALLAFFAVSLIATKQV